MVKKIFPIIIVLFFTIFAGFSLLHEGLPPTHDGEYHVIRFYEFDKVLRDGNLYPRFAPDLNYGLGVPLFNYVYPFPNYLASFFHIFGISFIDAFKLNMFFATILSGIFFYLWSRYFWGNLGGIVSSVFYIYSPYRFVDIYIRGSVGEVWALAFFPAFLWLITKSLKEKSKNSAFISGILLALVIFSHNILALLFFSFILIYLALIILQTKDRRGSFTLILYSIVTGLGLSAIFWLPALMEKHYVTGLQIYNIEENFPEIYQLIFPSWGSGFSGGDSQSQMSFQIGLANLLAVFLGVIGLIFYKGGSKEYRKTLILFLSCFVIIFFLMLKGSIIVWQTVPLMDYFQFPWRFLSIEILISSFLAGSIFKIKNSKILAFLLLSLVFFLGKDYTKVAYYHYRDDSYYTTRSNFIDGTNSPGNFFNTVWMKNIPDEKKKEKIVILGNGKISDILIKSEEYKFNLSLNQESKILINTAYFPGWIALVNGKDIEIKPNSEGIMELNAPKGSYVIEVRLEDTPVRKIAKLISLSVLIYLFYSLHLFRLLRYLHFLPNNNRMD